MKNDTCRGDLLVQGWRAETRPTWPIIDGLKTQPTDWVFGLSPLTQPPLFHRSHYLHRPRFVWGVVVLGVCYLRLLKSGTFGAL